MAHAAKYAASACGHMLGHYDRSKKNLGDNIDPERTHLNYNLAPDHGCSQMDFIHQRLSEVRVHKRADVNVMCDWVITLPKEISCMRKDIHLTPNPEIVSRLFFERTYEFLEKRYGEKNVISAYVHRDETSDHMHFSFVPAVKDEKRGGEKLSAKEAVTRKDLKTFHTDLEKHLDSFRDWHFGVINEATKEGNKSIEELKRGSAAKELAEQQQMAAQKIQELRMQVDREEEAADRRRDELKKEISDLERKRDGLLTSVEVADLKGQKTFTGGLRGVSFTEYEALKRTAAKVDEMSEQLKEANARAASADQRVDAAWAVANRRLIAAREADEKDLKATKHDFFMEYDQKTDSMRQELRRLRVENGDLKVKISRLEQAVDYLKDVIKAKLPEMVKSIENRVKQLVSPSQSRGYGE